MPGADKQTERLILDIRIQPRASCDEIIGFQPDGRLKIRLTSPPVDGKANDHLVQFLAREFSTAKRNVTLISGKNSRNKRVEIISAGRHPLSSSGPRL